MNRPPKPKNHYVDNKKFLEEIIEYKKKVAFAKDNNLEKPRLTEYIGKCIWLISENLAKKPGFMNYSFLDEMKSDAIENCMKYFDNFDTDKYSNPFAYFTQITRFAFIGRIKEEEKKRYIIYKKFQESVLDNYDNDLMVDYDDNHLITTQVYDNINEFIKKYEDRVVKKKEKDKQSTEGLSKFIEEQSDE